MFLCPGCGANINYDVATKKMRCPYCDVLISPEDEIAVKAADEVEGFFYEEEAAAKDMEVTVFTCSQCGGELIADETTAVTFCSYCGVSTPLSSRLSKTKKPDYIIPFKHSIHFSKESYKNYIKEHLFAPSALRKNENVEKIRGIYMAYYVYEADVEADVSATTLTESRMGNMIEKTYYDSTFHLSMANNGIVYDGVSNFHDDISGEILPYKTEGLIDFEINYMSGYYADTTDISPDTYIKKIKTDFKKLIKKEAVERQLDGYKLEKDFQVNEDQINVKKPKLLFAPVYFIANRYGDRVCYGAVNGQTGKVYADVPISPVKYFLFSLSISVLLFLALSIIQFSPVVTLWICLLLGWVSYTNIDSAANDAYYHENGMNDAGLRSKMKEYERAKANWIEQQHLVESKIPKIIITTIASFVSMVIILIFLFAMNGLFYGMIGYVGIPVIFGINAFRKAEIKRIKEMPERPKAPFDEKIKYLIKPIVSLVIAVVVLIIKPVHDIFYYFATVTILICMVWSICDLISVNNILCSQKLPQFNIRGGDENEDI